MSAIYRLSMRERWSARSMIVKRWLVEQWFDPSADPICEIDVDGASRLVHYRDYGKALGDPEFGVVYRFFVAEGREIGPYAELFEYNGVPPRETKPASPRAPLHAAAKLRLVRRDRYPKIFINYRRDDADAYAGRLHEVLAHEFGSDEVFLAEFSIRGGEVWDWTIQQAVAHSRVVLALVGRQWLTIKFGDRRRIDDPGDLVRREIVGALDRGTPVIPVLLPEATIPVDLDAEHELRLLRQLQFHRITGARHWNADVSDLLLTIKEHLARDAAE
jgi:TIR domain